MAELIVSLIPLALGVVMSPLAIMALVAALVSTRSRANGTAFLVGWTVAVILTLLLGYLVVGALGLHEPGSPPWWVAAIRLVVGAGLLATAVFVYRRGAARSKAMARAVTPTDVVAAAPQLPGWLRAVETFTPVRSGLLGFGIFILNPVELSCTVLAVIDIRLAGISPEAMIATAVAFGVVALLPIAPPVILTLVKGSAADPALRRIREWIAGHTSALNAALLVLIGAMQLQKALSVFFG